MSYTVKPFYFDADGQEFPCIEPFQISSQELDSYKTSPEQKIATLTRPSGPARGPRPDGFRIEDEEGSVVFRYPSRRADP